jgi:hypothetical protein
MNDDDTKLVVSFLQTGSIHALRRLGRRGLDLKAMGALPLQIACCTF